MKFFKPKNIKQQYVFHAGIIFFASVTLAVMITLYGVSVAEKETAVIQIQASAKNLSERIATVIENHIEFLEQSNTALSLYNLETQNLQSVESFETYLNALFIQKSELKEIFIITESELEEIGDSAVDLKQTDEENSLTIVLYTQGSNGKILKEYFSDLKTFSTGNPLNFVGAADKVIFLQPAFVTDVQETRTVFRYIRSISIGKNITGYVGMSFSVEKITEILSEQYPNIEKSRAVILTENNIPVAISTPTVLDGTDINRMGGFEEQIVRNADNIEQKDFYFARHKIYTRQLDTGLTVYTAEHVDYMNIFDFNRLVIFVFIAALLMLFAFTFLIRKLDLYSRPLEYLSQNITRLKHGEIVDYHANVPQNEIDNLHNDIVEIARNLKQKTDTAEAIAQNDFSIIAQELSENDILAQALNKISLHFSQLNAENEASRKDAEEQLWIRKGRNEIAGAQRKSEANVKLLAENIIQSLVKYVDAAFGALYLYEDDGSDFPYIVPGAAYAFDTAKHFDKEFYPGEGLVGTCALERKKITLKNPPDDYIKIATGMGSMKPELLLIFPVFFEDQINAFIEIGFIKQPKEYKIQFIEQLSESIGAWIATTKINEQTQYLLAQSGTHAQELSAKETELRKHIEELNKMQTRREQDEADRESLINAVNHTIMTIEYTPEGIFLTANDAYLNAMGYKLEDLQGYNVLDLVKDQRDELENVIREVKNGKYIERLMKRYTGKGEPRWLYSTYTPYYNTKGEITKILYFAFDVTEMVRAEFDYQERISLLEETIRGLQNQNSEAENRLAEYKKIEEDLLGRILEKVREIKELKKIIKNLSK